MPTAPRRGRPAGAPDADEQGMVTAEFAVALPALVFVLAVALGAVGLAVDQVRCVDAARTGARAAARGDPDGTVTAVAARAAPPGASIRFSDTNGMVEVTVTATGGRLAGLLPGVFRPSASAFSPRESSPPP